MSLPQRWTDWFEATRKAAPHCFMQLATVDTLRLWRLIDREARARFCGPPPGSLWQPPKSDHYRYLPPTPEDHPAEDFSILVLTADQVDVLELAESPHRHWQYHGEGRGAPTRLVP